MAKYVFYSIYRPFSACFCLIPRYHGNRECEKLILLVYSYRGRPYLYTDTKYAYVRLLAQKFVGGGPHGPPPRASRRKKWPRASRVNVSKTIMTLFYKSVVESVICFCIICQFVGCTEVEKKKLRRIIRHANRLGCSVEIC